MPRIKKETVEELDQLRKKFDEKYTEQINYVTILPEIIKKFLNLYTGDYYQEFNKNMRQGIILTPLQQNMLKNIDLAFKNSISIIEPLYVYKGIDRYITNFSNKAFISTSLSYTSAKNFSGTQCCILKILLPIGTKILPLINIARMLKTYTEDEILLDRDGQLTITEQYINPEDNMTILECIYIHKDAINITD